MLLAVQNTKWSALYNLFDKHIFMYAHFAILILNFIAVHGSILLPHDCCCSTFSSFIPNILVLCHVSSFLNNTCSDLLDLIIHIIHGFLPPPNVSILSSQNDQERCPRPAGAVTRPRATRETLRRRRPVRRRSRSRSQGWVEYQRISGEDVWINTAPWVFENKGRWEVKFYLFGSLWKTAKLV